MASDIEQAWNAVFEVLPVRWQVARPVFHHEQERWVAFAYSRYPRRGALASVEARGGTESAALHELADRLREIRERE